MARRVIVVGGSGFFGSVAMDLLRAEGLAPLMASRSRSADLVLDVEDAGSLRESLRAGDVVIDAAGTFQNRNATLIEAALDIGFDVVDIADSLAYVRRVYALEDRIAEAGIRVFTACSTISAISAAMIRLSGITQPTRMTGLLVPATKHTAVKGTAASLLHSVGRPISVFAEGKLVTRQGWQEAHTFPLPQPLGTRRGYLFETADSLTLPRRWPSLQRVDFYVDANVLGLNSVFRLAAHLPAVRSLIGRCMHLGLKAARLLGNRCGGVAYEVESPRGGKLLLSLISSERGYTAPLAPAVLAVRALLENRVSAIGLIPPEDQVEPDELIGYLKSQSIHLMERRVSD